MEKKKIVATGREKYDVITLHSIFKWKLESEKDLKNGKFELFFEREIPEKSRPLMYELESGFFPHFFPTFVVALPSILGFILFSIFLILYLVAKNNNASFDLMKNILIFFIPGGILLLGTVLFTYLNSSRAEKFYQNKEELIKKAKQDVAKALGEKND